MTQFLSFSFTLAHFLFPRLSFASSDLTDFDKLDQFFVPISAATFSPSVVVSLAAADESHSHHII